MKVIKSPQCTACSMNAVGSLSHYLLYCPLTEKIREKYVPQFVLANPKVASLANNETALLISILDPESSLLPEDIRHNWESSTKVNMLLTKMPFVNFANLAQIYTTTTTSKLFVELYKEDHQITIV